MLIKEIKILDKPLITFGQMLITMYFFGDLTEIIWFLESGLDPYLSTEEVLTTLGSNADLRCSLEGGNLVWKRENGEPVPNKSIMVWRQISTC